MRVRMLMCLALVAATVAVYAQVHTFEFVNYDDPKYIANNPNILHGVSVEGVRWAFTPYFANYIPVTVLTFLFDFEMYDLDPAGYHATNVVIHTANAVLLLLLLARLTGAIWPSALVAALFALHPLHVESVAWISSRKDVVSTFLGLVTLLAYARYVRSHRVAPYLLACILFALGLLAKSMIVTLPCVLLLLDFWPLHRARLARGEWPTWRRLAMEKLPFFAIAVAVSALTIYVQRGSGAMPGSDVLTTQMRIENALVSYVRYLVGTLWPVDLVPYYVHPKDTLPAWQVFGAAWLLVAVSVFAWRARTRAPYLLVGWLWYLGTLVPVIGLIQVGGQAMADRYTYVPLIGIFIAVAWALEAFVRAVPRFRHAAAAVCACMLAAFGLLAHQQAAHWRSSIALFEYTLSVNPNNPVALGNLGDAYITAQRYEDAAGVIARGLQLNPSNVGNLRNMAVAQRKLGNLDEAERLLRRAMEIEPNAPRTYNHLALVMMDRSRYQEAEAALITAIGLDPEFLDAHVNLGNVLLRRGELAEASKEYEFVLQRRPRDADALTNLGTVRLLDADYDEAITFFQRALAITPRDAVTRTNLAIALQMTGRIEEAKRQAEAALRDDPNYTKARQTLEDLETLSGE